MGFLFFFFILGLSHSFAYAEQAEDFNAATRLFTAELYSEIAKSNKNDFAISAFSLEGILLVLQTGAVGDSGEEIRNSLHLPSNLDDVEDFIYDDLMAVESDFHSLSVVKKMWVEGGSINSDFQDAAEHTYLVILMNNRNFNTSKVALDGALSVTLTNDVSYQSGWEIASKSKKAMKFYPSKYVSKVATGLSVNSELNHYESKELDAQFIELPLEERTTLTIVLPNSKDGINILEKNIEKVFTAPEYKKESIEVTIPNFKIDTTLDLTDAVKNIGIKKILDPSQADLSGIGGEKGDIYVSKIEQKVSFNVDDNGVNAAANEEIDVKKAVPSAPATKAVTADHPFIFYVRAYNSIIYAGRVSNP